MVSPTEFKNSVVKDLKSAKRESEVVDVITWLDYLDNASIDKFNVDILTSKVILFLRID